VIVRGLLVASLLACVGCSPIVGADCRAPLVACGHYCLDVRTDNQNCGACGNFCGGVTACVAGACVPIDANLPVDAGNDGGRDTGVGIDVGVDMGVDAGSDAGMPDAGPHDAGPTRCGLGQLLCGTSCYAANDPTHCGDCTTACGASEVCDEGSCTSACAGGETSCGGTCVTATTDHEHCGNCTTVCSAMQVCRAGVCAASSNGHLVVIGHDYVQTDTAMDVLLANAVMLGGATNTRVVGFTGTASSAMVTGIAAALADGAGTRTYTMATATTRDDVPALIGTADALLVYPQDGSEDSDIDDLGDAWGGALGQFLHRGGVVVVLDTPSVMNNGTNGLLARSGLFIASAHSEVVAPTLMPASGRSADPLLVGVTVPYTGMSHTVYFQTLDGNAVVSAPVGPVAFHRVITP
jgi:hypothetical protein